MKLLVLNGPNLNLLGIRQPDVYGTETYAMLQARIAEHAAQKGISVDCVQSNHEGVLVDAIQAARGVYDGMIINAAAYTHTSIALLDALLAVGIPAAEVHLTDTGAREPFRRQSYLRQACLATYQGLGFEGYIRAMDFLVEFLSKSG